MSSLCQIGYAFVISMDMGRYELIEKKCNFHSLFCNRLLSLYIMLSNFTDIVAYIK